MFNRGYFFYMITLKLLFCIRICVFFRFSFLFPFRISAISWCFRIFGVLVDTLYLSLCLLLLLLPYLFFFLSFSSLQVDVATICFVSRFFFDICVAHIFIFVYMAIIFILLVIAFSISI